MTKPPKELWIYISPLDGRMTGPFTKADMTGSDHLALRENYIRYILPPKPNFPPASRSATPGFL